MKLMRAERLNQNSKAVGRETKTSSWITEKHSVELDQTQWAALLHYTQLSDFD